MDLFKHAEEAAKRRVKMQPTSLEAWAEWLGSPSDTLDGKILIILKRAGEAGMMCWEIECGIERSHQSVSGNLRHLVERGLVRRLDTRGRTPSGRAAYHWAIADDAAPR